MQAVEEEKTASVDRATTVTAAEVAAARMVGSKQIAEQRKESLLAVQKAEEQTRAAQLEAELARRVPLCRLAAVTTCHRSRPLWALWRAILSPPLAHTAATPPCASPNPRPKT